MSPQSRSGGGEGTLVLDLDYDVEQADAVHIFETGEELVVLPDGLDLDAGERIPIVCYWPPPSGDFMPKPMRATPAPRAIIMTPRGMNANAKKPPTITVTPPTFTVFLSISGPKALYKHGRVDK